MSETGKWRVKAGIVTFNVIVFICVVLFPSMDAIVHVDCTRDYFQEATEGWNKYFEKEADLKRQLMIVGGIMSDIAVVFMLLRWMIGGKTWRMPIALVGTYLTRWLCAATFRIRYPANYLWENPGLYSLTVPYGMANDFHFTVHIALLVIVINEFFEDRFLIMAYTMISVCGFQAFLVLVTRGAYTIDLIAAVVFGHFFWLVGGRLSYYIDVKLLGLPF